MTSRELARYADVDVRMVKPALKVMEELGMVVMDEGTITVPNFLVRQYESDNVTARTRAFRERSKERSNEDDGNVPKNVLRNVPETETETETDKESRARKRPHPLPKDWNPSRESIDLMRQECPRVDLKAEHRKFVDHWHGNGKPMKQWDSVWRNWIRRAPQFQQPINGRPVQPVPSYEERPAPEKEALGW
jgi:hypothetical protein